MGIEYFYYGSYFENIRKDIEKATSFYKQGSKLDCRYSMTKMGNFCQRTQKYEKAIKYHKMSGLGLSFKKLGDIYVDKFKDYETAEKYYMNGINLNCFYSMKGLALMYENVYKNYEMAIKYYEMAGNLKDSTSLNNIGYIYEYEYNNYDKAKQYYSLSCDLDNNVAYYNLGQIYHNHYNDTKKAKKYYLKSIELDAECAYPFYCLGYIYLEKNKTKAKKYFQIAASLNYFKSMIELSKLHLEENDLNNAEKYLILAHENGLKETAYYLAKFYYKHKNNIELAEKYYKLSLEPKAIDKLYGLYIEHHKYEDVVILASKYKKESVFELLNKLTYPISEQNKKEIYEIIDNFNFSNGQMITTDILNISRNIISMKQKSLVQIAYFYKKYQKIDTII